MKKCMKCGGSTKKMAKGGTVSKPFAAGIPYASGAGATDGKNGMMKKGGAVKKMAKGGPVNKKLKARGEELYALGTISKDQGAGMKDTGIAYKKAGLGMKAKGTALKEKGKTMKSEGRTLKSAGQILNRMQKGGSNVKMGIYGIPQENIGTSSQFQPTAKKGGAVKKMRDGGKVKTAVIKAKSTDPYPMAVKGYQMKLDGLALKHKGNMMKAKGQMMKAKAMNKMESGGSIKNAKLAAIAAPKNKITRADIITGAKRNAKKK